MATMAAKAMIMMNFFLARIVEAAEEHGELPLLEGGAVESDPRMAQR